MGKLIRYLLSDLLRNRIIIASFLLFSLTGWGLFLLESNPEKIIIIMLQLTLLALPLLTMVFGSIYYYNSMDFIVLILSQPIRRTTVIRSFYISLTVAFMLCYLLGIGLPLLSFYPGLASAVLLLSGLFL
ncbi:MAG: ABC transporter permease, partial [Flavobacteriales bacterium]|nr:ABC transporter permease [Flavobacteriales bacterium]